MDNKDIISALCCGFILGVVIMLFVIIINFGDKTIFSRKQLIDAGYARYTTYGAFEITDVKLKEVLK